MVLLNILQVQNMLGHNLTFTCKCHLKKKWISLTHKHCEPSLKKTLMYLMKEKSAIHKQFDFNFTIVTKRVLRCVLEFHILHFTARGPKIIEEMRILFMQCNKYFIFVRPTTSSHSLSNLCRLKIVRHVKHSTPFHLYIV